MAKEEKPRYNNFCGTELTSTHSQPYHYIECFQCVDATLAPNTLDAAYRPDADTMPQSS